MDNIAEALEELCQDDSMPPVLDIPEMGSQPCDNEDKRCYGIILNQHQMWLLSEIDGETGLAFGYKCTEEDEGFGYFNSLELLQKSGAIPIPCFVAPKLGEFAPKAKALCKAIKLSKDALEYMIYDTMTPEMIEQHKEKVRKMKEWGIEDEE